MSDLTAVEARFRSLNPVPDPTNPPSALPVGRLLLPPLHERMGNMQTQQEPMKTDMAPSRRIGPLSAAAFVVILMVGVATVLVATSDTGDVQAEESVSPTPVITESATEGVLDPPYWAVQDAADAFVLAWNEGTYSEFDRVEHAYGAVNQSRQPAEQEEQFLFRRALDSHLELGECTENSPTSITCQVTQSDRVHDLLSGGPDSGYLITISTESGLVRFWNFSLVAGRDPGFWAEWRDWEKGNATLLLGIDPRRDTGAQLKISADEAAKLYVAEVERFLSESGLG